MDGPDEPEAAKSAIPGDTVPEAAPAEDDIVAPAETTKTDDSLLTVDQARDRLESKLQQSSNGSSEDSKDALLFDSIQLILKDHDHLKEKVGKLKSLLGRSAKAQRETKVEMDATQKRLDQALVEVQKLQQKMEKLSNRPSHMVRLSVFESFVGSFSFALGCDKDVQLISFLFCYDKL
jgi:chromosome segregation ATPase